MPSNRTDGRPSSALATAVAVLATVLVGALVVAGFFLGRWTVISEDAERITSANYGETLLGAVRAAKTPDDEIAGILAIYGRPPDAADWLGTVSWVPPPVPAPVVGHMARPGRTANAEINRFGFRDRRDDYPAGTDTFRVFITGGSTAYGSGAASQDETLAGLLERRLDARMNTPVEVVNTAYPAWSSTQERLLIEQRLIHLAPDRIVMFSGNNDVHWGLNARDIAWYRSYYDEHFLDMVTASYDRAGLGPVRIPAGQLEGRRSCPDVAAETARNVSRAAAAAREVGAELVFVLQPNVFSSAKPLSARERVIRDRSAADLPYWAECYAAMRVALGAINQPNYRFLDLSTLFGDIPAERELFIDSYHFGTAGNEAVAQALSEALVWPD